jgi:hypothetical protein
MINLDTKEELRRSLRKDEKLVWSGRPKTGIVLRRTDIFLIPFGLALFFPIPWQFRDWEINFSFFIWTIPSGLICFYFIFGHLLVDARIRAKTVYGITSERIIIKTNSDLRLETHSLDIKELSDILLTEKEDKSGTITFGTSDRRTKMFRGMEMPGLEQPPRLELIEDVKAVHDKILDLKRQINERK